VLGAGCKPVFESPPARPGETGVVGGAFERAGVSPFPDPSGPCFAGGADGEPRSAPACGGS